MSKPVLETPVMSDETGQDIVTALGTIASGLAPNASGTSFESTGCKVLTANTVQGALVQVDDAIDNTNSSLTNLIKSKNISGTTNAGGAVSSGLYAGNNPIIHCVIYSTGATYFGTISQVSESSDLQYITVHNSNGAIITNTAITGIVYYLDLSAL